LAHLNPSSYRTRLNVRIAARLRLLPDAQRVAHRHCVTVSKRIDLMKKIAVCAVVVVALLFGASQAEAGVFSDFVAKLKRTVVWGS
jgi:hypothetical protein